MNIFKADFPKIHFSFFLLSENMDCGDFAKFSLKTSTVPHFCHTFLFNI